MDQSGSCRAAPYKWVFGKWNRALEHAGLEVPSAWGFGVMGAFEAEVLERGIHEC